MFSLMKLTNDAFTLVYVIHTGSMQALFTNINSSVEVGANFITVVNSHGDRHTLEYESLTNVGHASLFFRLDWAPYNYAE